MHWVIHLFDRNVLGTLLGNGNTMEVGDTKLPCRSFPMEDNSFQSDRNWSSCDKSELLNQGY